LWQRILSFFGYTQQISNKVSVSKDLNYNWMESITEKSQPTKYDEIIKIATKEFQDMVSSNEGWEILEQNDDLKIYSQIKKEITAYKSETKIPFPPEAIISFIQDERYTSKWNRGTEDKILEKLNSFTSIKHKQISGRFIVKDRDIVFLHHITKHESKKNTFFIVLKSIDYELIPKTDRIVRVEILGGGFKIEPSSNNSTLLTYLYWADIGPGIPQFLINQASKEQGSVGIRIRNTLVE